MKKIILTLLLIATFAISTFAEHFYGYATNIRATFDGYNYTNWVSLYSRVDIYTSINEIDVSSDLDFDTYYRSFTVNYNKKQQFKYSNISNTRGYNYNLLTLTGYDSDGKYLTVYFYIYDDSSSLVYFKYSNIMYEYLINRIYQ